jgi:hypothetical protein
VFERADTATVAITIAPVNDAPVLAEIGDQETEEDVQLIIEGISVSDIEGDSVMLEIVGDPQFGSAEVIDDSTVHYTPDYGFSGADNIVLQATEVESGLSNQIIIAIEVAPVNDAPVADSLDIAMVEDVEITITLVGYDEDTPGGLAFVIADSTAHGSLVTTGGATYSYTPDTDYNGSDSFTYNVFDGEMYSELATVSISITPINDAPILSEMAPQEMDEDGGDLTLTLSATDRDNSELVFSAISDNEAVAVSIDGNILTIAPDPNHFGNAVITVVVSDSILTDSDTLALTINSVNDPPVVAGPIADVIMAEDSPDLTLAFLDTVFKDVDDSNLTFSYDNSNPDLLTVSIDGENVVTVTLKPDSNGTATLTFTATDDNLVTITDEVVITVTPVNDASQLTVIDTPQFGFQTNEKEDQDISLTVDDVEFDAVEITVVSGPFHGTYVDTTATDTVVLTYSPNPGFFGNDNMIVQATDSGGLSSNQVNISVWVSSVNDAPVVTSLDWSVMEDGSAEILLQGYDADGHELTLFIDDTVDNGSLILPDGNSVTYEPSDNFNGSDSFTYTANDGTDDDSNIGTVSITVSAVNDPPVVIDTAFVDVADLFSFSLDVDDVDDVEDDVDDVEWMMLI